ncbi:MAG: metallophosphoesterase family protein [Bryobacterales bacterium]|nr:metallophosphoesterase family protein [Bryobacterales bacterium]
MRYLILSDIHGNQEALSAVLKEAQADGFDAIVCLGDVVGYGADPNPVVEWVKRNSVATVRGNHDKASVGLESLEWFNPAARASALWTRSVLTIENQEWLRQLPRGPVEVGGFQILHGSPVDEDEYLLHPSEVAQLVGYLDARVSFFGHTHIQGGFRVMRTTVKPVPAVRWGSNREELTLELDSEYLINPGSVGQPRDRDPRAAWALYSPEERLVVFRRVEYDVPTASAKIVEAGLPAILAQRLHSGQ